MKIAILVAGDSSKYFPLFFDKPKCLYHLNGTIQLEKVILDAKKIVSEEDIIVVAGYKYKHVKKFLKKFPKIELRINENFRGPAIYSFRKATENIDDDIVYMFGDESISLSNIRRISNSDRKLSILYWDTYYYYSLGIMKLRKDQLDVFFDDKYLSMDAMKEIYCFANNKTVYDGTFDINSGICIGYIMIDIVSRIGGIEKIEHPGETYSGNDIDFLHYDPEKEYIPDLDHFYDTDEYKKNFIMKIYSKCFSDQVKKVLNYLSRKKRK